MWRGHFSNEPLFYSKMNYFQVKKTPYTLTKLIQNNEFINWVLHPDENSNRHWEKYISVFPKEKDTVENAKGYIILLAENTGRHKPTAEQSNRMRQVVESHTTERKDIPNEGRDDSPKIVFGWNQWRVAASVAILTAIGIATYLYNGQSIALNLNNDTLSSIELPALSSAQQTLRRINDTESPMTVNLSDGSSIVLLPGGVLDYSGKEIPGRREVSLSGRAFFEIVKNRDKPFFVYTEGITTKVLGTSFLIDAPNGSEEVIVEVKTGKVAIFPRSLKPDANEREAEEKPILGGLILRSDEKVSVSRLNGKLLQKEAGDATKQPLEDISKHTFFFDDTPVSTVFAELEQAYNVKINYDPRLMANCPLNATLVGEPLNKKLAVICAALDAKYELNENRVTITGRGCL